MSITLKRIFDILEPIPILVMLGAFWYASPTRDHWLWLLVMIPVSLGLRWLVYGRVWTTTSWHVVFTILVIVAFINVCIAPYRRTPDISYSYFVLMARVLLGIFLFSYFVERAREFRSISGLAGATLVLAILVAILALGASQWNSKSVAMQFIIDVLPRISASLAPFDAKGGFNANEIAGALAWLCPLTAGLIAYQWERFNKPLRILTGVIFFTLFAALFLGQSRFALAGTLIALFILVKLLLPARRIRWIAWTALIAIAVLEILIVRDVFVSPDQAKLAERDEGSMSTRVDIWARALQIMGDYPVTGVGLNMFRDGRVRALYPVPTFPNPVLPHTHNEWLQVGTDMGFPGLLIFITIQAITGYLLYKGYRRGSPSEKAIFAAVGAGLFAHAFFGLGDAITLWDRFAFVFWWLIALGGAQYVLQARKLQL